jgi:hypothetical protein
MRGLLLALALVLAIPATASGAVTLSRDGDTLRIVDDPGESARTFVALGVSALGGEPSYYSYESETSGFTSLRAGPGCTRYGPYVSCPPAGVTQVVATLGDGDDSLSVDAGPGAALVMDGGPGNDGLQPGRATSVTITGGDGDGDDAGGVSGTDANGVPRPASSLPSSVVFDGGAGEDSFGAAYSSMPVTARTGDGDDRLNVLNTTGPVTLDAGAGNDYVSIGSDDPDLRLTGGGRTVVLAGPGDDDIETGPDGDEDVIDCGPGRDRLRFNSLMYRHPSLENLFSLDCPPVGVRLDKRARLKGRTVRFTVHAPRAIRLLAVLGLPPLPKPAGRTRGRPRLHTGVNRVSIRLTRTAMRKLGRRRTVTMRLMGVAISPTGDGIDVGRWLEIKRR